MCLKISFADIFSGKALIHVAELMKRTQVRSCLFAHAVAKSPELTNAVWWGQLHSYLVGGKVVVGADTITPSLPQNPPQHTHSQAVWSCSTPVQKRSTHQLLSQPSSQPTNTHTRTLQQPSSLPSLFLISLYFLLKSHYLCPLFKLRTGSSRWDRMEDEEKPQPEFSISSLQEFPVWWEDQFLCLLHSGDRCLLRFMCLTC